MIQAVGALQEKAAIFCTSIRSMKKTTIKDELIYSKYSQGCLSLTRIVNVGREAETLVLALERLFFVYSDRHNAAILAKVLISPECLFLRNVWRKADHI